MVSTGTDFSFDSKNDSWHKENKNVDIPHFQKKLRTLLQQDKLSGLTTLTFNLHESMNEKIVIETSKAPGAVGPYSQAIKTGNLLFTSGQLPIDPATGKMAEGSIGDRAHQAIKNLAAIIEDAGGKLEDVIKTTVFLSDIGDFQEVNVVYAEYFSSPFPARSAFQVAALPLGADIEIEAVVRIN